jgi:hypothetical protein
MKKYVQKGTNHRWEWTESDSGELTITAGYFTGSLNQLVERIAGIGGNQVDKSCALIRDALKALGRSEEVSAVFGGYGYGYGSGSEQGYGAGCGHGDGCGRGDGYGIGRGNGDGARRGRGNGNGNGDGSGNGRGSGEGDGNGNGKGRGNGDGYGYGYGNGQGDGNGQGQGDGSGKFYGGYIFKKLVIKSRKPAGLECE